MTDTKKEREKRKTIRLTPDSEARLKSLKAFYERKAALNISDNDVIQVALRDACRVNKCEPAAGGTS